MEDMLDEKEETGRLDFVEGSSGISADAAGFIARPSQRIEQPNTLGGNASSTSRLVSDQPFPTHDREPQIVGDEIIRPTARRVGETSSLPARERGWISAITNANAKKEISVTERGKNVQEIVDAALQAGMPGEVIKLHLHSLGIHVADREQAENISTSDTTKMDESIAAKILGSDRPATNAEKIAAATQYPGIAARWGWSPEDIEELRQELAVSEGSEKKTSSTERTLSREQLEQIKISGRLYGELLTTFAENPNITKEELMKQIGAYSREHRLAGPDLGRAVYMANKFCQTREVVRNIREQFPDDRALFEHTFGFSPKGNVAVIMGAIDIGFYIPNIDDRARVHTGSLSHERSTSRLYAGAVIDDVRDVALSGLVIALEDYDRPDNLKHEQQHVINNQLLRIKQGEPVQPSRVSGPSEISERIKAGESETEAISSYFSSLVNTRSKADADEIIAYAAGGVRIDTVKNLLTEHNIAYGASYRGVTPVLENLIVQNVGESRRSYVREQGNNILGDNYANLIRECVDAFQQLRSRGYSQEQATGLLAPVLPRKWKAVVNSL